MSPGEIGELHVGQPHDARVRAEPDVPFAVFGDAENVAQRLVASHHQGGHVAVSVAKDAIGGADPEILVRSIAMLRVASRPSPPSSPTVVSRP